VIRTVISKPLSELWATGKTARIAPVMHARILRRLDRLNAAAAVEEMHLPGFDFHALRGLQPIRYTLHVNGPWCISFEFFDGDAWRVDFEEYR
jgi:proteic killer suppression protein